MPRQNDGCAHVARAYRTAPRAQCGGVADVLLAGDENEGQAGGMPARRLQVTIFLPESTGSMVQQVRFRYDRVMAGRVAPHVTLVYEVPDEAVLTERLVAACAAAPRFRIRFSGPQCRDGEPD